jgi:hypothetical protein
MFKAIVNKNKISRCSFAFLVPVADRSNRILAVSTVIVFCWYYVSRNKRRRALGAVIQLPFLGNWQACFPYLASCNVITAISLLTLSPSTTGQDKTSSIHASPSLDSIRRVVCLDQTTLIPTYTRRQQASEQRPRPWLPSTLSSHSSSLQKHRSPKMISHLKSERSSSSQAAVVESGSSYPEFSIGLEEQYTACHTTKAVESLPSRRFAAPSTQAPQAPSTSSPSISQISPPSPQPSANSSQPKPGLMSCSTMRVAPVCLGLQNRTRPGTPLWHQLCWDLARYSPPDTHLDRDRAHLPAKQRAHHLDILSASRCHGAQGWRGNERSKDPFHATPRALLRL